MTTTIGTVSGVPGLLSDAEIAQSAESLASLQLRSGALPWFVGGHCDPWNHVEAAMALTVTGYVDRARAAYRWLADTQLGDGSWFNYYLGDQVKDARLDTNVCAYVAAGLYHYLVATEDVDFCVELWPVVERALDFVLRYQHVDGTIAWSLDSIGRREGYALLTGSSSIFHSLRCAVALAERVDVAKPAWEFAAGRLGHAVAHHPGAFAPKNEFAMDWYYPIFSGALARRGRTEARRRRLGAPRDGRLRRALRVDQRLGDGGRDGRVRLGPRRARTDESRAGAVQLHPTAPPRRRRVLDRDRLPRARSRSRTARRRPTRPRRSSSRPTR